MPDDEAAIRLEMEHRVAEWCDRKHAARVRLQADAVAAAIARREPALMKARRLEAQARRLRRQARLSPD